MLEIREYGADGFDLTAIKQLFREYEAFLESQQAILLAMDQDLDRELDSLPGAFAPPAGNLYLALWEGSPVGSAAFRPMPDNACELKRLFVKPQAQGLGIGQALLSRAIADARTRGYHAIRLDSLRRLTAARRLYEGFGFTDIPPFNQNPHDDVYYMELPLAPAKNVCSLH